MRYVFLAAVIAAVTMGWSQPPYAWADELKFEDVTIDPEPGKVVYAVTVFDLNADGRDDIVAITEDKVLAYTSPDWDKHVLVDGMTEPDNVCIAAYDIDGDRRLDLAIGAGWPRNGGTIQWLRQGDDPTDPWTMHPIAAIPWTHRMQFADVLGSDDGTPQLVVSPLNAPEGEAGVALTAFSIPEDPTEDRWEPTVLSHDLNRMHNHLSLSSSKLQWPGLDQEQTVTLTASQEGVHVISRDLESTSPADSDRSEHLEFPFQQDRLVAGAEGDSPADRGAGEIKAGTFANGTHFIATIEPMHGTDAVVYTFDRRTPSITKRIVLTDQLRGGHALAVADLDKDGNDEVIVGWREPNPEVGISIFDRQADGSWSEQTLDLGGIACEDLTVADLGIDGRLDIVAGGRATHNIKLYLNGGPARNP